ncbi:MAG: hypothetical protein GEU28_07360, partial [Dehalococcoidia bacterium]|nr:hypothetical protein [Dehalococcoidia bacterium]
MDCRQVEELVDAYALGALDATEADAVKRHIDDCGDCRVQYESALEVAGQLALAVPQRRASRDLFHRTMADIYHDLAETQTARAATSAAPTRWFERGLVPVSALAAAVAAIASLGLIMSLDGRVDDIGDREDRQMSVVSSAVQEQALVNVALASDDLRRADLSQAQSDEVQGKYYWTPEDGVGVLWVNGLAQGVQYTGCFEAGENGLRQIPGRLIAHADGSAQKAFL